LRKGGESEAQGEKRENRNLSCLWCLLIGKEKARACCPRGGEKIKCTFKEKEKGGNALRQRKEACLTKKQSLEKRVAGEGKGLYLRGERKGVGSI